MTTPTINTIADLPISPRRYLTLQVLAALKSNADMQHLGVVVHHNPRTPAVLGSAPLAIVIKDMPDKLDASTGGRPKRSMSFVLAAVARISDDAGQQNADDRADRLHFFAANLLRRMNKTDLVMGEASGIFRLASLVNEDSTVTQVQGLEVDGALVASTWSIAYQ